LIFLLTVLGYATFAIGVTGPQNRITIQCILLLTAVNFRWMIAQRLPSVSYMTFLDKFAVGAIVTNSVLIAWDALAGSLIISQDKTFLQVIDTYALYASAGVFVFFVFVFILWFLKLLLQVKHFNWSQKRKYSTQKKIKSDYIDKLMS
jgi:hypothetical protein